LEPKNLENSTSQSCYYYYSNVFPMSHYSSCKIENHLMLTVRRIR
jgi:hypothetical protein